MPGDASALHLLALIDLGERKADEAIAHLRRCLEIRPEFPEAWSTLGRALLRLTRPGEALAAQERAVALAPQNPEILGNLGNALKALNRPAEAVAVYERARALRPEMGDLAYNEGLARLLLGDFRRGWELYEYRWSRRNAPPPRPVAGPLWLGREPLQGRSLVVPSEQGLGDTLQFVRYLPPLLARGAVVTLVVQRALKEFLDGQWPSVDVRDWTKPVPAGDAHCPLLSLPRAFATELATIPPAPYLRPPAAKTARWRQSLALRPGPKVGFVWAGGPGHQNDFQRSIPLSVFRECFRGIPGNFYGLQKDIRPSDQAVLPATPELTNLSGQIGNFADTAAIVANLDLVVAVDTAVAHLAGALGTPTWLLLPFAPDWRWLLGRRDSPWYPAMVLFRQPAPGDWTSVLAEVRRLLAGVGKTQ